MHGHGASANSPSEFQCGLRWVAAFPLFLSCSRWLSLASLPAVSRTCVPLPSHSSFLLRCTWTATINTEKDQCEDGDQIAVPAGPAGSCTNSTPTLIPTCDKTALAEYNLAQSAESRSPCCHGGGPGVPDRRAVGTPAQPRSSPELVVRLSQAGHQRCRSYRRPSSCTSCWRCPRRHLSQVQGPVFLSLCGQDLLLAGCRRRLHDAPEWSIVLLNFFVRTAILLNRLRCTAILSALQAGEEAESGRSGSQGGAVAFKKIRPRPRHHRDRRHPL